MSLETKLRTDRGNVRIKVNENTPVKTDLQIATPNAVCGVKGTVFSVNQTDDMCCVEAFDGTVQVNSTVTGESVQITGYGNGTGQRATVYNSTEPIYVETLHDMEPNVGEEGDFDQCLLPVTRDHCNPENELSAPSIGLASTMIIGVVASTTHVKCSKRKERALFMPL